MGDKYEPDFNCLVTTYEVAKIESRFLSNMRFDVGIYDEGHRLKNHEASVHNIMKNIKVDFRLLLTGTPIQNNTTELYSLLSFLNPQKFNDVEQFNEDYGEITTDEQAGELRDLLKGYMLRREKRDVNIGIPLKRETVVEIELTKYQRTTYKALLEKN